RLHHCRTTAAELLARLACQQQHHQPEEEVDPPECYRLNLANLNRLTAVNQLVVLKVVDQKTRFFRSNLLAGKWLLGVVAIRESHQLLRVYESGGTSSRSPTWRSAVCRAASPGSNACLVTVGDPPPLSTL